MTGSCFGFDPVKDLTQISSVIDQSDIHSRLKMGSSTEHGA